MKSVFADTFHFLALLKADDPHHRSALKFHRVKWRRIVTTDCVLMSVGGIPEPPGGFAGGGC
jgi:predicted nucleic acid-binding protein